MTKPQILLKMAGLKRDFAKKDLERSQECLKHLAISEEACAAQQLAYELAECEFQLALLDCP